MPTLVPHHLKECNSPASLGRVLIQKGTQVVLAMSYSVSVTAAQLMLKLYEQFYQQQPVDKALARSWQELYNNKQRNAAYSKSIELEDWLLPVAYQNGRPNFWGYLNELVEGNITNLQAAIEQSTMANVSGKRSKIVSATIGLQILEGFLSGFNLPVASIATQFTGAKTVSFSFQQVVRSFISPGQLGKLLQGHALDTSNGSNALFLNGEAHLLVIDSIITSKDFSINVDKEHSSDFSLMYRLFKKLPAKPKQISK